MAHVGLHELVGKAIIIQAVVKLAAGLFMHHTVLVRNMAQIASTAIALKSRRQLRRVMALREVSRLLGALSFGCSMLLNRLSLVVFGLRSGS